jgi:hypothetical protein
MENRRTWGRVLLVVILLGLGLRVYHYLRDPVMWHDEAAAVVNVLEKSWCELLGPLYWANPTPPLFLWAERAVFLALGDSTYALRLLPFLASCATVVLLAWVAWRLLLPLPAVLATLLGAVSNQLLWHTTEAKPYATDVLVAMGVLTLHVAARSWCLETLLAVHLVLAPFALWLSYPAAFVLGTSLLILLPRVVRSRSASRWACWGLYGLWGLVVLGAFAALVLGPARAQRVAALDGCWVSHFPPLDQPAWVPVWTVASFLEVCRYCFKPLGTGLALLVVVGASVWARSGRGVWVLLCALPLGLALVAAFLHQYPFGASRLEAFATPGLALLIGAGLPVTWHWLAARHRLAPALVVLLLLACVGMTAYHVLVPWYRPDAGSASAFVHGQLEPDDVIVGNKWEHVYYFRSEGQRFLLADREDDRNQPHGCRIGRPESVNSPGRCWLIYADDAPATRTQVMQTEWFRRHRLLEHRTFAGTDVYLLELPAPDGTETSESIDLRPGRPEPGLPLSSLKKTSSCCPTKTGCVVDSSR